MKTQTEILANMLANLPEKYDRTEGSVIYDILAPISIELFNAYQQADLNLSSAFVQTATGEDLDNKVAEIGMTRQLNESDDDLRARYFDTVNEPAMSGNVKDIENIALNIDGITKVRVIPCWDGVDTDTIGDDIGYCTVMTKGDSSGIVQAFIDKGTGGIEYVCQSVSDLAINVSATIQYEGNLETLKETIKESLANYIDSCDELVSYGLIGKAILDVNGVLDYSSLTVNSGTSNITVPKNKFAKLGGVTINAQ